MVTLASGRKMIYTIPDQDQEEIKDTKEVVQAKLRFDKGSREKPELVLAAYALAAASDKETSPKITDEQRKAAMEAELLNICEFGVLSYTRRLL